MLIHNCYHGSMPKFYYTSFPLREISLGRTKFQICENRWLALRAIQQPDLRPSPLGVEDQMDSSPAWMHSLLKTRMGKNCANPKTLPQSQLVIADAKWEAEKIALYLDMYRSGRQQQYSMHISETISVKEKLKH